MTDDNPIYDRDKMQQKVVYPTKQTPSYADWALYNMGAALEDKVDNLGDGLPEHTSEDAGKVLKVTAQNELAWATDEQGHAQVQANWNETDDTQPSYIQNKPTIPEGVPAYTTSDDGKILGVTVDTSGETPVAEVEWVTKPAGVPAIASGDAGKVLTVNAGETGVEWAVISSGSTSQHIISISISNERTYKIDYVTYVLSEFKEKLAELISKSELIGSAIYYGTAKSQYNGILTEYSTSGANISQINFIGYGHEEGSNSSSYQYYKIGEYKFTSAGISYNYDFNKLREYRLSMSPITSLNKGTLSYSYNAASKEFELINLDTSSKRNKFLHSDSNGNVEWVDIPTELPVYTSADAGKVLSVNASG